MSDPAPDEETTPTAPTATQSPLEEEPPPVEQPAPTPSHYTAAVANLGLAGESLDPAFRTANATLAAAHATMLAANETRVGNLIGYLAIIRAGGNTPAAYAKIRLLEDRIDAALGLSEVGA